MERPVLSSQITFCCEMFSSDTGGCRALILNQGALVLHIVHYAVNDLTYVR